MVLSVVFLVVFSLMLYWMVMDVMGQVNSHSLPSHPLNIVLAHLKEVKIRAHNLSMDVRKKEMHKFCRLE